MIILMGIFIFIAAICFIVANNVWMDSSSLWEGLIVLAFVLAGAAFTHIYVIAMLTYYRG